MKKRFALYGMFAAMALFATACGDDSSSGPEEESSSSIEAEEESSSSVEEEAPESSEESGDAKSSSSETKKGDSSSSEKAASSSSAAVSSSSHYSTEPTCTPTIESKVATAELTYYGTEIGDVRFVLVVDYDNLSTRMKGEGTFLMYGDCAGVTTAFKQGIVKSCSDEKRSFDAILTFPSIEAIEDFIGTLEYMEDYVCKDILSTVNPTIIYLNSEMLDEGKYGTFRDTRDAKLYHTIEVGGQTWMAQNLNYATSSESSCYNNDEGNCLDFGRLYTWEIAQNVCPDGWRLPTATEWDDLLVKTMGATKSAQVASGVTVTQYSGTGVSLLGGFGFANTYGLSFVRGGFYGNPVMESSEYSSIEQSGAYWLGVEGAVSVATVYGGEGSALTAISNVENKAFSVRCLKDSAPAQPGVSK